MPPNAREGANIMAQLYLRLPILGYALRCLIERRDEEFGMFCLNVALVFALGMLMFGHPFLMGTILAAVAIIATAAIGATLS